MNNGEGPIVSTAVGPNPDPAQLHREEGVSLITNGGTR